MLINVKNVDFSTRKLLSLCWVGGKGSMHGTTTTTTIPAGHREPGRDKPGPRAAPGRLPPQKTTPNLGTSNWNPAAPGPVLLGAGFGGVGTAWSWDWGSFGVWEGFGTARSCGIGAVLGHPGAVGSEQFWDFGTALSCGIGAVSVF